MLLSMCQRLPVLLLHLYLCRPFFRLSTVMSSATCSGTLVLVSFIAASWYPNMYDVSVPLFRWISFRVLLMSLNSAIPLDSVSSAIAIKYDSSRMVPSFCAGLAPYAHLSAVLYNLCLSLFTASCFLHNVTLFSQSTIAQLPFFPLPGICLPLPHELLLAPIVRNRRQNLQ